MRKIVFNSQVPKQRANLEHFIGFHAFFSLEYCQQFAAYLLDRFFVCSAQRLESLRNLRILVLSFNEIQKMDGLSELVCLERLELGYNCIKHVEGVKVSDRLHTTIP